MRINKIFLALLLNAIFFSYGQNLHVVYQVIENKNYHINQKNPSFTEQMQKLSSKTHQMLFEIAKDFEYDLLINSNESLYQWKEEMANDDVNNMDFNFAILLGGVEKDGKYYQNKNKNLVLNQIRDPQGVFYRETSLLFNKKWKITDKTDRILGYKVWKATQGKQIVWFTPDIPVPFGPSGYGGLPGLILKYSINNRIIDAKKIDILKKTPKIKMPKKGKLRTQEEGIKKRIRQMNRSFER